MPDPRFGGSERDYSRGVGSLGLDRMGGPRATPPMNIGYDRNPALPPRNIGRDRAGGYGNQDIRRDINNRIFNQWTTPSQVTPMTQAMGPNLPFDEMMGTRLPIDEFGNPTQETWNDYLGDIGGWDEVKMEPNLPWGTRLPPKPGKPPWGGPSEFDMANMGQWRQWQIIKNKLGEVKANQWLSAQNVNRGGIMGVI